LEYYEQATEDKIFVEWLCYKKVQNLLGAFETDSEAPKISDFYPVFFPNIFLTPANG